MIARRSLLTAVATLAAFLTACGGADDPSPDGAAPTQSGSPAPTYLLSTVYLDGKLSDEYTYDPDTLAPTEHKHYDPVTGDLRTTLTVMAVDDDGLVTVASATGDPDYALVRYTYDDQGRRSKTEWFDDAENPTTTSVYTIDGGTVTQTITGGRVDRTITYTLDARGNVTAQRWTNPDAELTFADFDDVPNPWSLTNGLIEDYPVSSNRYASWVTSAGCAFTSTMTYDDAGLLVTEDSVGCTGPDGSPVTHQYRYEYLTP